MVKSGLRAIDDVLFKGLGCPPGSFLELYGESQSGKTALALSFCSQELERGGQVGWVATEQNLTNANLRWAGLQKRSLTIARQSPHYGGLLLATALVEWGARLVVIDSLTALMEGERPLFEVLAGGLPTLKEAARRKGAVVVWTNQVRNSLRRVQTPSGLSAITLKSVDARIKLVTTEGLYRGGLQRGVRIAFTVVKNGTDMTTWGQCGRFNLLWEGGVRDVQLRKVDVQVNE